MRFGHQDRYQVERTHIVNILNEPPIQGDDENRGFIMLIEFLSLYF